ncbi:hypothetical protein WH47_12648, partial [Habropoda laboriosa]
QNKKAFNKHRKKATEYKQGQLVAIKRTQVFPGLKFHARYLGPYRVTKVLRGNRYVVQKSGQHEGPQTSSTAADYMKPWVTDEKDELFEDSENTQSDNDSGLDVTKTRRKYLKLSNGHQYLP